MVESYTKGPQQLDPFLFCVLKIRDLEETQWLWERMVQARCRQDHNHKVVTKPGDTFGVITLSLHSE